jgi:hypothetical protein
MCRYAYESPGHAIHGGNYPTYAQGAYLPGDEPGTRCSITRDTCDPTTCECREESRPAETGILCPSCLMEDANSRQTLLMDENDVYSCPKCEDAWNITPLLLALAETAQGYARRREIESAERQELDDLRQKMFQVRCLSAAPGETPVFDEYLRRKGKVG